MIQTKDLFERGITNHREIAKQIGQHPFAVQKALTQSKSFTIEKLKSIYNQLLEADNKVKTSQAELDTLLNLLIIQA